MNEIAHFRASLLLLVALGSPARGAAGTIVSSFGPANSYALNGGLSISTVASSNAYETAVAVSFTPSVSFELTQIDLALGYLSGTNSFVLKLVDDNSGPTGLVIETWTFAAPVFGGPDLNALTPLSSLVLNGGSTYWIVALPGGSDTWGAWNHPSPDTFIGGQAISHDRGATWYPPVVAPGVPAFDVLGIATPEPGTVLVTAFALAGLVTGRRNLL